jgi:hypothetical protein
LLAFHPSEAQLGFDGEHAVLKGGSQSPLVAYAFKVTLVA